MSRVASAGFSASVLFCLVLGGWELLHMGKRSEFTALPGYLKTCPQWEVERNLRANLPHSCDSIRASKRIPSLLWVWTGLSDGCEAGHTCLSVCLPLECILYMWSNKQESKAPTATELLISFCPGSREAFLSYLLISSSHTLGHWLFSVFWLKLMVCQMKLFLLFLGSLICPTYACSLYGPQQVMSFWYNELGLSDAALVSSSCSLPLIDTYDSGQRIYT